MSHKNPYTPGTCSWEGFERGFSGFPYPESIPYRSPHNVEEYKLCFLKGRSAAALVLKNKPPVSEVTMKSAMYERGYAAYDKGVDKKYVARLTRENQEEFIEGLSDAMYDVEQNYWENYSGEPVHMEGDLQAIKEGHEKQLESLQNYLEEREKLKNPNWGMW